MNLVKQLKFFHLLSLSKIDREKVFAEVLGVSPWFSSKMGDYANKTKKEYLTTI